MFGCQEDRTHISFVSSFFLTLLGGFGQKEKGGLKSFCRSVDIIMVMFIKAHSSSLGSGRAVAMAFLAACSGISNTSGKPPSWRPEEPA